MAIHQTKLELSEAVPPEFDAAAAITLKIQISCPEGCDVSALPVQVEAAGEIIFTGEPGTLTLKTPAHVGEHTWTVRFRRHETNGMIHEESSFAVCFMTRRHTTSMAVWDVPSPALRQTPFNVKTGVKCSAGCPLTGQSIEIWDESGVKAGGGALGEVPWPGTSALYVAEVGLKAPAVEGMTSWSARFAATERPLPHAEASATFSFRTAGPPEHAVTVKIIDKAAGTPIEDVDVRLGIYRAMTDPEGLARLEVPTGVYNLDAWKPGYETVPMTVEVTGDLTIPIEALFSNEPDPDESRVWM